eukprot:scaffold74718_cov24-Attheya_sp.AAC.2
MGEKTLAIIRKPPSTSDRGYIVARRSSCRQENGPCGGRDAGAIASRGRARTIAAAARGSSSGQG